MTQVTENTQQGPQQFLSRECRILDRYELQADLVETLGLSKKHAKLIPRLAACHRVFRHWRCEQNHDWAEAENSCCLRVCPHCSRRRSLILSGRVKKFLVERGTVAHDLRYLVLAERNCSDLNAGIDSLWRAWGRLRRCVQWTRKVEGCIVALEVTYNASDGTWHPHLNVMMAGEFFPFEELNRLWVRCTNGNGATTHIEAADLSTVHELIKYVTKLADLIGKPAVMDEFLDSIKNRRLVRTYGSFFGITVDDEENPGVECPDCGSHVSIRLGIVHPSQIKFDFEREAFRVARPPGRVHYDLATAESFEPASFGLDSHQFAEKGTCFVRARHDRRRHMETRDEVQQWESKLERLAIQGGPKPEQLRF